MAIRDWTTGQRILGAWLVIALVGGVGWIAGAVYADIHVDGLDRERVCANTGVALGDTILRSVERARRDSTALADRNCSARYALARQGARNRVRIPVVLVAILAGLVAGFFTLRWMIRGAWRRLRR